MSDLRDHEEMAINFIGRNSSDTVGVIDSEEKLAAAWIYVDLCKRGYLIASLGADGPTYRLTRAGKRAYAEIVRQPEVPHAS